MPPTALDISAPSPYHAKYQLTLRQLSINSLFICISSLIKRQTEEINRMSNHYAGHLPTHDPLHFYLQNEILPRSAVATPRLAFASFTCRGAISRQALRNRI